MKLKLGLSRGIGVRGVSVPSQLGASAWFRANTGVTVVSGKASAITDSIGGVTLSQGTAGNRLTYTADFGDGACVLETAGTGWITGASSINVNSDFTVISLIRTTADGFYYSMNNSAAPATLKFYLRALSGFTSVDITNDAASTAEATRSSYTANAWHVVIVRRLGTTLKVRADALADATISTSGTCTTNVQTIGALRADGTSPMNGQWRETQVYQLHQSDANVTAIIADIRSRWPNVP